MEQKLKGQMEQKLNELLRGSGYQVKIEPLRYSLLNEEGEFLKDASKGDLLELIAKAPASSQTQEQLQDWVETLF